VGIKYIPKQKANHCLVDYLNYEMKLVEPIPRKILKSDLLKSKKFPLQYSKALHEIEIKISRGEDLTYHLSKKALDPACTDDLLNDWFIHHLHLSISKSQQGQKFYDRSKYLLFAFFNDDVAFLIDVREHNENYVFAKKEFLEIMDINWPEFMKKYYWDGVTAVTPDCSDAEIAMMRQKGYTVGAYNVNGKAIKSPGVGIMTSGHNVLVVKRADEVCRYLHSSTQEVIDECLIKKKLSEKTGIEIVKLDLSIRQLSSWPYFALFEKNSKQYIEKDKLIDEADA
jgi:hypothetical protein